MGGSVRAVGVVVTGVRHRATVTERGIVLDFHDVVLLLLQGVGSLQDAEHGAEDQRRDARGQRALHLQGDQRLRFAGRRLLAARQG